MKIGDRVTFHDGPALSVCGFKIAGLTDAGLEIVALCRAANIHDGPCDEYDPASLAPAPDAPAPPVEIDADPESPAP